MTHPVHGTAFDMKLKRAADKCEQVRIVGRFPDTKTCVDFFSAFRQPTQPSVLGVNVGAHEATKGC